MKLAVYTIDGKKNGSIDVDDAIFGIKPNAKLIAQASRVQLSRRHAGNANTKDRSEVSGGGKKPWRQKGTGRARAGSSRSPIWRGGGVTFGPTNDSNYQLEIPKKMRQAAIYSCLSQKAKDSLIFTIDSFKSISRDKLLELFDAFNLNAKKILFVTQKDESDARLKVRNVAGVKTIGDNSINVIDVLSHDAIVWSQDTLKGISK